MKEALSHVKEAGSDVKEGFSDAINATHALLSNPFGTINNTRGKLKISKGNLSNPFGKINITKRKLKISKGNLSNPTILGGGENSMPENCEQGNLRWKKSISDHNFWCNVKQ